MAVVTVPMRPTYMRNISTSWAAPGSAGVMPVDRPTAPAYGLIERPARPAPDLALVDALGKRHAVAESRGRVTLNSIG